MLSPRHLAIGAFVVWVLIDSAIVFRWQTGASENRDRRSLGALIGFDGFGLALGDWRSFALLVLLMPLPYLFRIREEEAALAAAFGTEYAAYRRRTKRLIPGIY